MPVSGRMIDRLTSRISQCGCLGIFIFRLTPFTRGYTSVIAGLLRVKPKVFLPIAFLSAAIWATTYVSIGHFIGPSWNLFAQNTGSFKYLMLALIALISLLFLVFAFNRKRKKNVGVMSDY